MGRVHAADQFSVKTHSPNLGAFTELLLAILLMLSALTGASLIAIFSSAKYFNSTTTDLFIHPHQAVFRLNIGTGILNLIPNYKILTIHETRLRLASPIQRNGLIPGRARLTMTNPISTWVPYLLLNSMNFLCVASGRK